MTFLKGLLYVFTTIVIYLIIGIIEYFSVRYLIEAYIFTYISKLAIYLIMLIPIDTTLTYLLIKAIPFRPRGLRKINTNNIDSLKYQNQKD